MHRVLVLSQLQPAFLFGKRRALKIRRNSVVEMQRQIKELPSYTHLVNELPEGKVGLPPGVIESKGGETAAMQVSYIAKES